MTAEFFHYDRRHTFPVEAEKIQASVTITSRACAKSPTFRFYLRLNRFDSQRGVAVYDVLAFESV